MANLGNPITALDPSRLHVNLPLLLLPTSISTVSSIVDPARNMAHIPPAGLEKAAPADIRSSNYEGDQELKLQDRKTKQANYIRWDDPCVETIPEGEAAKIKAGWFALVKLL